MPRIGSQYARYVKIARVRGDRLVQAGSKVELVSDDTVLRNLLGEGPFIVLQIKRWPCGCYMLYIKGGKVDGTGVHACDFK